MSSVPTNRRASPMAPAPAPPVTRTLPRSIGWISVALAMVGLMIGSGIFRVPSSVAMRLDSVWLIGGVWVLGGVLSLFGALTWAELATMFPRAGGEYVYLREGFGPLLAFLYGWNSLLIVTPAAIGALAVVFAGYFTSSFGAWEGQERWVAIGVLVFAMLVNYRSLAWTALVENVASGTKLVALAAVGVVALVLGAGAGADVAPAVAAPAVAASAAVGTETGSLPVLGAFILALVTVMWTYAGWGWVTNMAGEVQDPGRSMPKAMGGGVLLVVILYLIVNAGYLNVMSVEEIAASTSVAGDAMGRVLGPWGLRVVGILVMISTFGALIAATMFGPRIYYAMAVDGFLFRRFARVHEDYGTPHVATLLAFVVAIGFVTFQTFEQLAGVFILGGLPFQILIVAVLFKLRRQRPDLERPYRTWGYPFVPLAFAGMAVVMLFMAAAAEPLLAAMGTGIWLLAVPAYFWLPASRGKPAGTEAHQRLRKR